MTILITCACFLALCGLISWAIVRGGSDGPEPMEMDHGWNKEDME